MLAREVTEELTKVRVDFLTHTLFSNEALMIDASNVTEFLEDELGIETSEIATDTPLFSGGIVDSFALVNLMMFLENQGGFRINPVDVNLDNLDSIDRIVAFSERCLAA
jgi:acyl carrier protein